MKLKKLCIICTTLTCLILTSNAFAEEQQSFIRKVVGGWGISELIQMKDGSYAYLNGHGIAIVKDVLGETVSEISLTFVDLPCTSYQCVSLKGMAQTSDGFVIVGWYSEGDDFTPVKGIVIKVNTEGRVLWAKVIGANRGYSKYFQSVIPTADGGFIVSGFSLLTKFSPRGSVQWSFNNFSSFLLATPTLDDGVIVAELSGANVMKVNGSGKVIWAVTVEMKKFKLQSVTSLSNGRYVLAGKTKKPNRLILVTLNEDGTVHSNASYSLDSPDFFVHSIAQTPDDGLAIGGTLYDTTGTSADGFLLKINDRLKLTFKKRLGFPDSYEDIKSVIPQKDGSYLLFGSTEYYTDTLFVRLNSHGSAPGCDFSQHLNASKVLSDNINLKVLEITPKTLSVPRRKSFTLTSELLTREISSVCAN